MRVLALCFLCLPLVACSFTDGGRDDDDDDVTGLDGFSSGAPAETHDPTVDETYTALFDADASVPSSTGLEGLWQVRSKYTLQGRTTNVRMRFADGELQIAMQWGGATFGVTSGYQLKSSDDGQADIVVARDVSASADDGTGDQLELTTKSGTTTAYYKDYGSDPIGQHVIMMGGLFTTSFTATTSGSYGGGSSTGQLEFEKIGD